MPSKRILLPLLLTTTACLAQSPASTTSASESNSAVTGRVFCGDTGRPARFARVSLRPLSEAKPRSQRSSSPTTKPGYSVIAVSAETDLDGSYTLRHVSPGVYSLIVQKEGYLDFSGALMQMEFSPLTDQQRSKMDETIPRITVEQNATVHADVQLQRGAAVSGTITYDDGAPASGITIEILTKDENGEWRRPRVAGSSLPTDDRGFFRVNSLLSGTYILSANLNIGADKTYGITDSANHSVSFSRRTAESYLSFYVNGTPYIDQASTFTLKGDEERTGTDMTIPISKLHRLTGRVTDANGHFVNAARIELISDITKKPISSSTLDREDNLFHFEFVPEGEYTLHITNARDVTWDPPEKPSDNQILGFPPQERERVLKTYGDVDMPLILSGDMTDITATVPAKQNTQSTASN